MGRIFPDNWFEVGVHVVVALLATALVAWLIDWRLALLVNTIAWPLREALQERAKPPGTGLVHWYWPGGWSVQKHWEAWAPVLVGWLAIAEVMARG